MQKEAIVYSAEKVEIIGSPIPKPGPDQLVIKVVVSGSNPKDWKAPGWTDKHFNTGDDIAGTVHAVGAGVYEFKPGDRVAAFHEMHEPGGSFAEYALAWAHTTAHIPDNTSFEEAATIPLAALTAVLGMHDFRRLALLPAWARPADAPPMPPMPLIVYGASSAVGAYTIQLAALSDVHPIIGIAGRACAFAESLITPARGDAILDYRVGPEALVKGIKAALVKAGVKDGLAPRAFDAISGEGSHEVLVAVLAPDARITNVAPLEGSAPPGFSYPDTYVATRWTYVGNMHRNHKWLGFVGLRWIFRAIHEGRFKPHPHEVIPGGLGGVSQGLQNLKSGRVSAVKYVFRIADTEGAGNIE